MERIIGEIQGSKPGPLLIFVGGIHGNESTGITALEHVFNRFDEDLKEVNGRAIALRGNLQAIRKNLRFISMDLNRIWDIKHNKRAHDYQSPELIELEAIRGLVEKELAGEYSNAFLIDLHTTSAPTIPFIVSKLDTGNKEFIESMNIPFVTGLTGHLDGTMLAWMCEKGHCGLAFEAGQHHSKKSILKHEAFVELCLYYTGFTPNKSEHDVAVLHDLLEDELAPRHNHFTLIERYKIDEEEDFEMEPGYSNFARIHKGEVLAQNKYGDICSAVDGNIFMPLYQKQGNDGFFIIEPV